MERLFKDASKPVNEAGFTQKAYADDLNAYWSCPMSVDNEMVLKEGKACQANLHQWGATSQVTFDAAQKKFTW